MEVVGEANAILVTDRMLKTSEVEYVTQDTKCGGHALVFVVISNPSQEMNEIVEMFISRRKK